MLRTLILALCLAFASPALAEPRINGETSYKPHTLVRLNADGVDAKSGLLWRVYPSDVVQRATSPRGVLEFAAPPGKYDVELLVIKVAPDGAISVDEARVVVKIESCHPPETPPNPPAPKPGNVEAAIGRIVFGNAGCSATVVGPRRSDGRWDVLTAAHCVANVGQRGTLKMPSGSTHAVTVAVVERTSDVCWLVTDDVIETIEHATLAKVNPAVGVAVWHQGYGVDKPRNREEGTVAERQNEDGQIRFILSVSSGDSGGGIIRADTNEVVGTVCCTAGMAQKVSMWAGSCETAWKLRPKTTGGDVDDVPPAPMPLRPVWTPTPIPTRPAASAAL